MTILAKLIEAGVTGLPFSWDDKGDVIFHEGMPEDKKETVLNVFANHEGDYV